MYPWIAASAAIHGLFLFFWLQPKPHHLNFNASDDLVLEFVNIEQQTMHKIAQTSQKNIAVDTARQSTFNPTPNHVVVQKLTDVSAHNVANKITRTVVAFKNKSKQLNTSILKQPIHKPVQLAQVKEQLSGSSIKKIRRHKVHNKHSNSQPDTVDLNKIRIAVRSHLELYKFYPASARRRGIEGHVDVAFKLISHGAADQVSVLHSSGYTVLDHAALEAVYRAQPFPVGDGKYRFRLTFKRL